MDKKKRSVLLLLVTILLLSGLTGCEPKGESKRFQEKPATFFDGIWHGLIFFYLPKSCQSSPGYAYGVAIGYIWNILFWIVSLIWVVEKNGNEILAFIMLFLGYMGGILTGTLIYWSIYGLVIGITWLLGSVGIFFKWLFSH